MVHGQAEINMREFDPRRFGPWATKDYTAEVSVADYHHMYYCYKPGEQHVVGRGLRKSPLHDVLLREGAQFQQVFGWERARWYDRSGTGENYSFKRSNWFDSVREECLAVRERAGLMDLPSFAKFDVTGKDAYSFLDRICANKIPTKIGGIVLTHLLNENGFIESEMTITRLGEEHFYVLSGATAQLQDLDQLMWRKAEGEDVHIADVTDRFGTLILAGPKSRDVLTAVCEDWAGRWLTGRMSTVAGVADVRLLRVNYVGELGWELHVHNQSLHKVFEALMASGKAHGIRLFGTYAMNSLRMEKAYRGFGSELTAEIDMYEASMERFIREDKSAFTGKQASLTRKQRGPRMKLVYLAVDNTDSDCMGNEPVLHDGVLVGLTTSGAFGHACGQSLAFAYVKPELAGIGTAFEVMVLGAKRAARIIPDSIWDPSNLRLKA
jgi:dimethylglycine dehydrogenase